MMTHGGGYSLEEILENYKPLFIGKSLHNVKVVGDNIFECGSTLGSGIYLCGNGLLATEAEYFLGRTTMECINNLCNRVSDSSEWLENEENYQDFRKDIHF